jgi:hypothetical protein
VINYRCHSSRVGLRTGSAYQDICNDRKGIGSRLLKTKSMPACWLDDGSQFRFQLRFSEFGQENYALLSSGWRRPLPRSKLGELIFCIRPVLFYSHDGALVSERYGEIARREPTLLHMYRLR